MSVTDQMASPLSKERRAITLSRRRTTVYVEHFVLESFDLMCADLGIQSRILADMIDLQRDRSEDDDFTSAFRVAVLAYWRSVAQHRRWAPASHLRAALVAIGGEPDAA